MRGMMRFRGLAKKLLFGCTPGLRGRFRYYGELVYFPHQCHLFQRACAEGIYEQDTTNLILSLVEPETTYFDVGANIGLLSVPVLALRPAVKVVSIEASPETLGFLRKTHAAAFRNEHWTIIAAAAGAQNGEADFWSGTVAMGAFDGLRDTGRGGPKSATRVPVRALDDIWRELGCPQISIIKLDIEGCEYSALQGATEIISRVKPLLILEWNEKNLRSYGIDPSELLDLSISIGYSVHAVPGLVPISSKLILKAAMAHTETFVLAPRT